MSDPGNPAVPAESPDATPTEALQLADQQPAPAPNPPAGRDHTRTILEAVGGVVAVSLIAVAGAVGFVVGQASGSDDVGLSRAADSDARGGWHDGPEADGPIKGLQGGEGDRGTGHGPRDGRGGPGELRGQGPGQG